MGSGSADPDPRALVDEFIHLTSLKFDELGFDELDSSM